MEPSPARLLGEFRAFERSLALRAAIEIDLFTRIEQGVDTVRELAAVTRASERGIRILCDYLTVTGHLSKHADRYSLPLESRMYLVSSSAAYIGPAVRFLASDGNLQSFSHLTEAIINGGAAAGDQTIPDTTTWVGFARFMVDLARPTAEAVAAALEIESNRPLQVLDIAAGSGVYGLAVATRNPSAHVYALDAQEVLEVAARNAQLAGATERYHLVPGDAFQIGLGGPYDLILMVNFAHHFDVPTNTAFFEKCRRALKPMGRLALVDFIPNDDRVSPAPDAAFALTMLATTERGDAYTFREFSRMLQDAGFSDVRRPEMGDLPQCLITATRT